MNLEAIWNSVLGQLQLDMPRSTFETWVAGTRVQSLEEDVLSVAVQNVPARDWLESRLTSTLQRLMVGILNRSITVRFVVVEPPQEDAETGIDESDESELNVEPVQWLDYDRIVQPHKQVVVKGYLRRLGMEIGAKAIWLYIGFHQAAWKVHSDEHGAALHSRDVMRFSGLSFGAFWRSLRHRTIQEELQGLVQRIDTPHERKYHRGRDGRPHRRPVRYQVCMTPRLTRADAAAVCTQLHRRLENGLSLAEALQELIALEDLLQVLSATSIEREQHACNTVMEMIRQLAGDEHTPELDRLAQELHRRIINALGDIHIPHYFITETIHRHNLTPAQAWLITVARDMAYVNPRTGERRDLVSFKGGYQEMAELVGSGRYKTVQTWFNPQWAKQHRGGDMTRFLVEQEMAESGYADLRVGSMSRSFRVLLDEPLDANGSNMVDADGSNSRTRMGVIVGANGSHMLDANGTALNSLKHPLSTHKQNTSTTRCAPTPAGAAPDHWELGSLLRRNQVHPKVQRELLDVQASVHAFVSWVLFAASPQGGKLADPLGYAISRLRAHPLQEAGGVFRQFAGLPPRELLALIQSTPTHTCELPKQTNHPLAAAWKRVMGSSNPRLPAAQTILFGEGDNN